MTIMQISLIMHAFLKYEIKQIRVTYVNFEIKANISINFS